MSLVPQPNAIRLAMLGSTPGNGHPYSWSAMFNGYNREAMTKECPFAGIPVYLNKQPAEGFTIPGAQVTHIHCEGGGGFTAEHVAKCSLIPHVVAKATDVIGQVDAVIIATEQAGAAELDDDFSGEGDDGGGHSEGVRCSVRRRPLGRRR